MSPQRTHPRPGLTPAAIVTAGITLVERDGLEKLTMRAVAAELNTAATSLYRHVADRDALLLAMLERIAADLPVDVPGRTPRQRLLTRLTRAHDHMAGHNWVMPILIRGELVATSAFGFSDACLADFLAAGLEPRQALTAYGACWHLTVGELLERHPHQPAPPPTQRSESLKSLDPEKLPALVAVRALDLPPDRDDYPQEIEALLQAFVP